MVELLEDVLSRRFFNGAVVDPNRQRPPTEREQRDMSDEIFVERRKRGYPDVMR